MRWRDDGVTHLAIEASSHGLDQRRLDGVRLSRRRLHQYHARSSRLSPRLRGLSRGEAAPVRGSVAAGPDRRVSMPTATSPPRVAGVIEASGLKAFGDRRARDGNSAAARRDRMICATSLRLRHAGVEYQGGLAARRRFPDENALVAAGLAIACRRRSGTRLRGAGTICRARQGRLELVGKAVRRADFRRLRA